MNFGDNNNIHIVIQGNDNVKNKEDNRRPSILSSLFKKILAIFNTWIMHFVHIYSSEIHTGVYEKREKLSFSLYL